MLLFDLQEGQEVDAALITQLMAMHKNLSIVIKPKVKQNVKAIMVRGQERDSKLLFDVRRQLLYLNEFDAPMRHNQASLFQPVPGTAPSTTTATLNFPNMAPSLATQAATAPLAPGASIWSDLLSASNMPLYNCMDTKDEQKPASSFPLGYGTDMDKMYPWSSDYKPAVAGDIRTPPDTTPPPTPLAVPKVAPFNDQILPRSRAFYSDDFGLDEKVDNLFSPWNTRRVSLFEDDSTEKAGN